MQYHSTHYSYLYSCLTHTQCEALNARLPGFWENQAKLRFFVFDHKLLPWTTSDFLPNTLSNQIYVLLLFKLMSDPYPVRSA